MRFIDFDATGARTGKGRKKRFRIRRPYDKQTASAPALAFGDGDTGLWEPSDDVLMFGTSGAAAITIAADKTVTLAGNLVVSGTQTTVDSTTLTVDDKNLELGSVDTPSDTTADGGGITLKGATDKTFNWVNSTDAWTSSEHINLASGKTLKLDGTAITSTAAELNYTSGVTSAIQTQLNAKAPTASPTFTGTVSGVTKTHVGLSNVTNDAQWHAGNDGSGSGLDADTVDGIQASSFLRSDADDTVSKQLTFSSTAGERPILQGGFLGRLSGDGDCDIWGISETYYPSHATAGSAWGIQWKASPNSINFVGNGENRLVIDLDGGSTGLTWEGNKVWNAGNDGSGSGLDADTCDGQHLGTGSNVTHAQIHATSWFRNDGSGEGLYNTPNDAHFYSAGNNYWHINGNSGDITSGALIFYDQYNSSHGHATGRKGYVYWDGNGFGLLSNDGSWAYRHNNTHADIYGTIRRDASHTLWDSGNDGSGSGLDADTVDGIQASSFLRSDADDNTTGKLVIGGNYNNNPYNSVSSTRLLFGGGDSNALDNYYIGTNMENYGGNYTKLDLRWHTGIRMGAQQGYGGVRIYDSEDLGTVLFSVGKGDGHTRVESGNLYIGGNAAWHAGNDGSGSGLDADTVDGSHKSSFLGTHQTNNLNIVNRGYYTTDTSNQNQNSGTISYGWGYQESGSWSHPYPDIVFGYHTGMKFGGHTSYGGCRFYADHPSRTSTELFSIGNGDSHVRVANNLYVGGALHVSSTGAYIGRHLDATATWGSGSRKTLFLGWSSDKVVLGNNDDSGHDWVRDIDDDVVGVVNPLHVYKGIKARETTEFTDSSCPITFKGGHTNYTGTYTQTGIYTNQNNSSNDPANGIFIERRRLTDSSSGEISNFTIGSRGGQKQFIVDRYGQITRQVNGGWRIDQARWRNIGSSWTGHTYLRTPIHKAASNMFRIKIYVYEYGGSYAGEYVFSGYAYAAGSSLISTRLHAIAGGARAIDMGTSSNGNIWCRVQNSATYYSHYSFDYIGWGYERPEDFSFASSAG